MAFEDLYLLKGTVTIQLSYIMNHVNESATVKVLSPSTKGRACLKSKITSIYSGIFLLKRSFKYLDRERKKAVTSVTPITQSWAKLVG